MTDTCVTPYGTWAPIYQKLGMWPRPLRYPGYNESKKAPYGKSCHEKGWTTPDHQLPAGTLERWAQKFPHYNIGLLCGSPFPDGTRLGAVDIDHDRYIALGKVIFGNPECTRIGKKGIVIPIRYKEGVQNRKIRVKGSDEFGQVVELLIEENLFVIPPSIHPQTKAPYRWEGTPLHKMDYRQLPLIGV